MTQSMNSPGHWWPHGSICSLASHAWDTEHIMASLDLRWIMHRTDSGHDSSNLSWPIMAIDQTWCFANLCYWHNILQQQNLVSPGSCQLNCSDWQCQFCHQVVSSHTPKNSAPGSFLRPFEHQNSEVNKSCGHGTRWPMLRLLHGLPMRYVKLHWDRWRSCSLPPAFEESDHWYPAMSSGTSKFEGNAGGPKHLKAAKQNPSWEALAYTHKILILNSILICISHHKMQRMAKENCLGHFLWYITTRFHDTVHHIPWTWRPLDLGFHTLPWSIWYQNESGNQPTLLDPSDRNVPAICRGCYAEAFKPDVKVAVSLKICMPGMYGRTKRHKCYRTTFYVIILQVVLESSLPQAEPGSM